MKRFLAVCFIVLVCFAFVKFLDYEGNQLEIAVNNTIILFSQEYMR